MAIDKKAVLVDSVKKLLALDVPEAEIVVNLGEVGVSREQARELIAEAKKEPMEEHEEKKIMADSGKALMDVAEKLSEAKGTGGKEEDAVEEMGSQFPEELAAKKKKHRAPIIFEKKVAGKDVARQQAVKTSIDRLWEKGILTAINQKLNEMKSIKEDLDRVLEKKLEGATRSELERINVAFESQRSLLVSQMEERLEEKFREASYFVEQKLVEIKAAKSELAEASSILSEERKAQKQFLREYEASVSELRGTKETIIAEMNSELIRAKSNAQSVVDAAEAKIREIDERVSRTLELESNIAQGLLGDAESKIQAMVDEKAVEARLELSKTMQGIKGIRDEIEKSLKKKIAETKEEEARKLIELKSSLEKKLDEKLEKLDRLYSALEKEAKKKK